VQPRAPDVKCGESYARQGNTPDKSLFVADYRPMRQAIAGSLQNRPACLIEAHRPAAPRR
jgi:hypothetical protein